MAKYEITFEKDMAIVSTPFNPDFRETMRALGGKWNQENKTWSTDVRNIAFVREAMHKIFGRDDYPTDLTSVKITFNTDYYSTGYAYLVKFGRLLATAKDSNTLQIGSEVTFYNGRPLSYLSSKNNTVGIKVPAGTVAILYDIPRNIVERQRKACEQFKIAIEYLEETMETDVEKLMNEKNRLLARIVEIDLLIQKKSSS